MKKSLAIFLGLSTALATLSSTTFAQSPPGTAAVNAYITNNSSISRDLVSSNCSAASFVAPPTVDPLPSGSVDYSWCGANTHGTGAISYNNCTVNYGWVRSFRLPSGSETFVTTSGGCAAQILTPNPNNAGVHIIEISLTN